MKIGLVRRGFSRTGGAEAYLRRFAEAASSAGHELVLFSEQWPADEWLFEFVPVRSNSPRSFASALLRLATPQRCDCLFSFERVRQCDCYRAGDGVHAAWLERRARFDPFWQRWLRHHYPKHREMLWLERDLFTPLGSRAVIANSKMVAAEIALRFAYPEERIHVIYNGVAPSQVSTEARETMRRELGFAQDACVLFFAGSGWARKGLRFAIAALAAAAVRRTILLVAGRGRRASLPSSPQVRFLGPVQGMGRYFAAADLFILPTIYDPFSNACLEATAAGLPVITTAANGFAEIIEPGVEGEVIAKPDDVAALTAAIQKWSEPTRRAEIRPRLQALGARYSIERNLAETLAVLETLLSRR